MRTSLFRQPCAGWRAAGCTAVVPAAARSCRWLSASTAPNEPEPLRILFCGSDAFSCASLEALHGEMEAQKRISGGYTLRPGLLASLDVLVRPAKRTGRGLKKVQESPVKAMATALGLTIHERDTFTGWQPPPVNIVIAVSFGLFVPPRILGASRYGGLNVHPSLLPDLRGASPIEHAILAGRTRTGVTVQTLDDSAFDAGRILLQGPSSTGLAIPPRCTSAALHRLLAPLGAQLLVETLRRGLYLPDAAPVQPTAPKGGLLAPKLHKADQQVPWRPSGTTEPTTADALDRRARALGALWTHVRLPYAPKDKRAILDDICPVACPAGLLPLLQHHDRSQTCPLPTLTLVQQTHETATAVTLPYMVSPDDKDSIILPVGVDVHDPASSLCLRIGTVKMEGSRSKPAAMAMATVASSGTPLDQVAWDVVLRG